MQVTTVCMYLRNPLTCLEELPDSRYRSLDHRIPHMSYPVHNTTTKAPSITTPPPSPDYTHTSSTCPPPPPPPTHTPCMQPAVTPVLTGSLAQWHGRSCHSHKAVNTRLKSQHSLHTYTSSIVCRQTHLHDACRREWWHGLHIHSQVLFRSMLKH